MNYKRLLVVTESPIIKGQINSGLERLLTEWSNKGFDVHVDYAINPDEVHRKHTDTIYDAVITEQQFTDFGDSPFPENVEEFELLGMEQYPGAYECTEAVMRKNHKAKAIIIEDFVEDRILIQANLINFRSYYVEKDKMSIDVLGLPEEKLNDFVHCDINNPSSFSKEFYEALVGKEGEASP